MFNFKKFHKNKNLNKNANIEKIYSFYIENIDFIDFILKENMSQKEKREAIKKIYEFIFENKIENEIKNVSETPLKVYRGITADTKDELEMYVENFFKGDMYFGTRASIYGTGTYTCLGKNMDTAIKYASNGNTSSLGVIIESNLATECKIGNYESLALTQEYDINILKCQSINEEYQSFIKLLNDIGVYAGILGYDAIYVPKKEYMIILNSKIIRPINLHYLETKSELNNITKK